MSKKYSRKGASLHLLKSQNYFQKVSCKCSTLNYWWFQIINQRDSGIIFFLNLLRKKIKLKISSS